MTRPVILGNGNMLVCIDRHCRIRDFYYPYVGQENHVSSNRHMIGVFVEGKFSWVSVEEWELNLDYKEDTLVSDTRAFNKELEVELKINEAVHNDKNIFLRQIEVVNHSDCEREIKLFLGAHFHISEANIGDTVYYNPKLESIVNYKGKRYFLMGGLNEGKGFDDYATGVAGVGDKRGTFLDAENGILSKNPIEHGSVDSTIGFTVNVGSKASKKIDYWIAVGQRYREVETLRNFILNEGVDKLMNETATYWTNWVNNKKVDFELLGPEIRELFKRSLLIVKAQTDNRGAIIAANDTHTFHYKKDTYSYMWPRDGALIARSLDKVGHYDVTTKFFNFCARIISSDGYLLHKYRPDGSLGSSWHSWLKGDKLQLPVQEDETALVLDSLWKHYSHHKDAKMIKGMYKSFIKRAGDFLLNFRDEKTGLPNESYDLWEEKLGIHTFTCCTVYAGLIAAKNFAAEFGNKTDVKKYEKAAAEIRQLIIDHLYNNDMGIFTKGVYYDSEDKLMMDNTVDVSTFYGLFEYNVLEIEDPRMKRTFEATLDKLWCKAPCGGLARYEGDLYYRVDDSPENPWFIATMWLAEYYIARAKNLDDLKEAEQMLDWAVSKALPSGVLSEQLNPHTGETLSVAPLTWSHAGFIIAVVKYLEKFEELGG